VRLVTVLLPLSLLGCGSADSLASSTFESGDDGWLLANNGTSKTPTLRREGGLPAGNICGTDSEDGDLWYFVAPWNHFVMNTSSAYGKRLTFDMQETERFHLISGRDLIMTGNGLALTLNFRFPEDVPVPSWKSYTFKLSTESPWTIDDGAGTGELATEEQLRGVLESLTSFRIRGEFVDGPDTACLDNVYFGRK